MFKLAIKVCFENHFGLINAIFLSPGSTKLGYFLGTPGTSQHIFEYLFIIQCETEQNNKCWIFN